MSPMLADLATLVPSVTTGVGALPAGVGIACRARRSSRTAARIDGVAVSGRCAGTHP